MKDVAEKMNYYRSSKGYHTFFKAQICLMFLLLCNKLNMIQCLNTKHVCNESLSFTVTITDNKQFKQGFLLK